MSNQTTIEPEILEANRRLHEKRREFEAQTARHEAATAKEIVDTIRITRAPINDSEADRIEAERRAKVKAEKVEALRLDWNAPIRHVKRRSEGYSENPNGIAWKATADRIKSKLGSGILVCLIGIRGPGKTQMAVEAMFATTDQLRSALYCTAMEIFMAVKTTYGPDAKKSEVDALAKFSKPSLLIIDEAHERGETNWEDRILTHIIDARYRAMKDTILIANLEKSECEKSLGKSVVTRLNETGGFIPCEWMSFREGK